MKEYVRYLALGDSYTIGESVGSEESWPNQLSAKIRDEGPEVQINVVAKTGWRSDELIAGLRKRAYRGYFDLISLLIGVNNQYQGKPLGVYQDEFQKLLEISKQLAGGESDRIFVVSIPDYSVTAFAEQLGKAGISQDIDSYNRINRALTQQAGIAYIDITDISRTAKDNGELVASDGLHPSGKMYKLWTDRIWNQFVGKLFLQ